jgi:hypothetical protein
MLAPHENGLGAEENDFLASDRLCARDLNA